MLDSDRKQLVKNTITMLTEFLAEHDEVMQKLADMRAGYPSGHEGLGGDGRAEPIRDFAGETKKAIDSAIKQVHAFASKVDGTRMSVVRISVKPGEVTEGCEIIARYAKNSWEPVYRTGDVGGRLPRKYALGQWSYDQVLANGSDAAGRPLPPSLEHLPTAEETQRHARGARVRRPKKRAS